MDEDKHSLTHLCKDGDATRAACGAFTGAIVCPLTPFDLVTMKINCETCVAIFHRDANEGNPFEPPETDTQRYRRIGEMIRANVDKHMKGE